MSFMDNGTDTFEESVERPFMENGTDTFEESVERPFGDDALFALMEDLGDAMDDLLKSVVINNTAMVLAIFLLIQWHFRYFAFQRESRLGAPRRIWRHIGLFCLTVQMYHSTVWKRFNKPFVYSCYLVLLDEFSSMIAENLCSKRATNNGREEEVLEQGDQGDLLRDGSSEDFTLVTCKYQDLCIGVHRIIPLFVIQLTLTMLYIHTLVGTEDVQKADQFSFSYWTLAVLLQLYSGDTHTGSGFSLKFWGYLLQRPVANETVPYRSRWTIPQRREIRLRMLMDFLVNGASRSIIVMTVPVLLSVSPRPLDFVKDCLGIYFISTLDDVQEEIPVEMMLRKMKKSSQRRRGSFRA